ncbi:DUF6153 family protein [Agromyces aureus]|uniref:Uncharacterized protein n=1 Tax=Agromyces aureus TaxID=453304 RepID=A0A191WBV4_9MICO|nr:DUF6153 family protein [Agromyces aureus]ANJ25740.1 hypothetical protein ATC03_02130 [Agromyces aureus]
MLMHLRLAASTDARLLLIALAVPSILIGLLAMHVLSGTASQPSAATHHNIAVVAASDESHHEGPTNAASHAASAEAASAACGPACEQEHGMLTMACLLALLVGALTLLAAAQVHRGTWTLRPIRFLGVFLSAPAQPSPPSLIALSISRT